MQFFRDRQSREMHLKSQTYATLSIFLIKNLIIWKLEKGMRLGHWDKLKKYKEAVILDDVAI